MERWSREEEKSERAIPSAGSLARWPHGHGWARLKAATSSGSPTYGVHPDAWALCCCSGAVSRKGDVKWSTRDVNCATVGCRASGLALLRCHSAGSFQYVF